jgi:hypothetical protein
LLSRWAEVARLEVGAYDAHRFVFVAVVGVFGVGEMAAQGEAFMQAADDVAELVGWCLRLAAQ